MKISEAAGAIEAALEADRDHATRTATSIKIILELAEEADRERPPAEEFYEYGQGFRAGRAAAYEEVLAALLARQQ